MTLDKKILNIIEKEDKEILQNILLDLCQFNKRNEERVIETYYKYR